MTAESPLILVVDDQPGVRLLVQEMFKEVGYRVVTASHGQEAVQLLARTRPALALVDFRMPIMDGLETLRFIRSVHPEVPVVMMTAVDDGEAVNEAIAEGARLTVAKPFCVFQLRETVRQVLAEG